MFTKQETILLPIFIKRVLVKPFTDFQGATHTPESVSVNTRHIEIRLIILFGAMVGVSSSLYYKQTILMLAESYGITRIGYIHVLRSDGTRIHAKTCQFTMFMDHTTVGELKRNSLKK